MRTLRLFFLSSSLFFVSCGGEGGGGFFGGGGLQSVPTSTCASGTQWQGGESGSAMDPGRDCIACHAQGEGPNYVIAGTVYQNAGEADDCGGVSGVTVEITGADLNVTTLTTNSAGNFYSRASIAMPYGVKLTSNNGTRIMVAHQSVGACNSCHTQTGANAAPGRIMAP